MAFIQRHCACGALFLDNRASDYCATCREEALDKIIEHLERPTMNCDVCNKHLEEEDTYESVVCKSCMESKEKFHCAKCKCELRLHKTFIRIREIAKNQKRFLLIILSVVLADGFFSIFWPMIGLKIMAGFVGVALVLAALALCLLFLFPVTFYFGAWTLKQLGIKDSIDEDEGGEVIGAWFTGLGMYILPFLVYFLGTLFLKLLKVIP